MRQEALAELRASLMGDPEMRQQLGTFEDPLAAALWLCRTYADGTPDQLAGALEPVIRGPGMPPPHLILQDIPPADFLPVGVILMDGELALEWLWLGADGLQKPFYYRSTERADLLPINALLRCTTPLTALDRFASAPPPDGLIFHMSRCGSTLVSQMLSASLDHVVVSEAPLFDNIVQLASVGAVPEHMVHAAAAALMRYREGTNRRGFIKLDALHSLALPMLRRVFPHVPWVFLYRDPGEVLVSHRRLPGLHVQQGFHPLDSLGIHDGDRVAADAYPAWVTEHVCRAALAGRGDPNGLFLNYTHLPSAMTTAILPHFRIAPDSAMLGAMELAARRDAKAPEKLFADDTAEKQAEARAAISVPGSLLQAYAQLERAAAQDPGGALPVATASPASVSVAFNW
ncbi:hypothetical protein [Aurantiacibacter marinus]|uniref:hypothetical protein n=1 Tax=Aurantiacibacter marinus TaxID=874156 RepID=UPI00069AB759|nr:hypothetical protein [Aurantiacibacter marinus]